MLATLRSARRSAARAAVLLSAALLTACGGDSSTGPGETPVFDTPRTEVPDVLVGRWMYGSISPTNFWNDHTGQYAGNAYGFADHITFQENGTYTRLVYIYTQNYGCRTQVWTQMQGTVTVDGETFTLYPGVGRYKAADTCIARYNFDRAMTRAELAEKQGDGYDWFFQTESGRTYLMVGPEGSGEAAHYAAGE
jgi:hypothetical protein